MGTKIGFKAALSKLDDLIKSYEGFKEQMPTVNFDDTIAMLKKERAELTNKIGKLNLKEEDIVTEDLSTPFFQGDDISANAALQYWTSIFGVFSTLESNVQDNVNKLAILNSLFSMVSSKISALSSPAQSSMANATAGTIPSPTASVPPMTPMPDVQPTLDVAATNSVRSDPIEPDCIEDEEEIESDEIKNQGEQNPSTEFIAPEVAVVGNPDEKTNDEADEDKKAVVDLTIEAKDVVDNGGHVLSFKEWIGIQPRETARHARTMKDDDIVRIANINEACLRGQALIQNTVAKEEAGRRSLNRLGKKDLSESTRRALELAGIYVKR